MGYAIKINKTLQSRLPETDLMNLTFGRVFSDHMFTADWYEGQWHNLQIIPFGNLALHPATTALHYGQAIFEGMKAYPTPDGGAAIFRPEDNSERLNISATRMAMPEVPRDLFMQAVNTLVDLDQEWIPTEEGSSLYIRPYMFATDEYVGIKASDHYKFVIFTCPVKSYYDKPVKVLISDQYVRAFPGGTGEAKAAGNYAATLHPLAMARQKGFDQLLWTDGFSFQYFQEIGTMNVFFIIDGKVLTPRLNGCILHGVTRHSVIQLFNDMGIVVEERDISVRELLAAYQIGSLEDAFGTGTAATISHISHIGYKDEILSLPDIETRRLSNLVKQQLDDIKFSRCPDTHHWMHRIDVNQYSSSVLA
ncbi:MAG: branched-chain amino acid aminotransferase [Chitinophagales bacterium]|nr:branched-chain amino acid aminotransferase [Chitinophagales bacterium]